MIWVRWRKEALEVAVADRTATLTAANEDLRGQKEQLDGLFELSPGAVILTDEDFHVLRGQPGIHTNLRVHSRRGCGTVASGLNSTRGVACCGSQEQGLAHFREES
jgi:hypothetical protein